MSETRLEAFTRLVRGSMQQMLPPESTREVVIETSALELLNSKVSQFFLAFNAHAYKIAEELFRHFEDGEWNSVRITAEQENLLIHTQFADELRCRVVDVNQLRATPTEPTVGHIFMLYHGLDPNIKRAIVGFSLDVEGDLKRYSKPNTVVLTIQLRTRESSLDFLDHLLRDTPIEFQKARGWLGNVFLNGDILAIQKYVLKKCFDHNHQEFTRDDPCCKL